MDLKKIFGERKKKNVGSSWKKFLSYPGALIPNGVNLTVGKDCSHACLEVQDRLRRVVRGCGVFFSSFLFFISLSLSRLSFFSFLANPDRDLWTLPGSEYRTSSPGVNILLIEADYYEIWPGQHIIIFFNHFTTPGGRLIIKEFPEIFLGLSPLFRSFLSSRREKKKRTFVENLFSRPMLKFLEFILIKPLEKAEPETET